jgi:hypothetical protein
MRMHYKNSLCLAAFAGILIFFSGCQYLNFFPRPSPVVVGDPVAVQPGKNLGEPESAQPGKNFHRIPPYVFLADFEIDPKLPLFRDLTSLRDQVSSELHLPTTEKMIQVFLFENRTKYEQYMAEYYPKLPNRRAFFVAMPRPLGGTDDLMVYTYWGDRIQQDLRHELTHALLHSVLLDVPMWLDEGLAEYFENPQGWSGINYKHLENLQRGTSGPFQPNLARLEKIKEVHEMSAADYREAWAFVHFMLRGHPKAKQVLLDYLHELRANRKPGPLLPRLEAAIPNLNQAILQHLKKLDEIKPAPEGALQ